MFHNSQAVLALSHEPNPTVFQKTLGINDFYFGTDDFEYPMGNIQMVGKSTEEMYRGEKPIETKLAPTRAPRRGLSASEGLPRSALDAGCSSVEAASWRAPERDEACDTFGGHRPCQCFAAARG